MQHYTKVDDIQFYIPPDIIVPTGLVLMVDGIRVDYEHYHFTDIFDFYIDTTDKELAMAIAERIVARIQKEHNDFKHGVTWRTVYLKIVTEDDYIERYGTIRVTWKYRVRDSY